MKTRIDLQRKLENILGSRNVYYQAPPSIHMKYPAIKYDRNNVKNDYADGEVYRQMTSYSITVMDTNPDSKIAEKISRIPTARFQSHYKSDGLTHDVYVIYY